MERGLAGAQYRNADLVPCARAEPAQPWRLSLRQSQARGKELKALLRNNGVVYVCREVLDLADPADCADVHRRKPLQPRLELHREKLLHLRGGRRLAALVLLRRERLTLERTAVRCATLALDRFAANPLPNRSVRLSAAGRCHLSVVGRLCTVSRSNARGEPTGRRYGSRTGVACDPVLNK